jgi:hypothetical protein
MSNDYNRSSIMSNRRLSRKDSFLYSSNNNHLSSSSTTSITKSTTNLFKAQNNVELTDNANTNTNTNANSNNFKINSKTKSMSNIHESKLVKKVHFNL